MAWVLEKGSPADDSGRNCPALSILAETHAAVFLYLK